MTGQGRREGVGDVARGGVQREIRLDVDKIYVIFRNILMATRRGDHIEGGYKIRMPIRFGS